MSFTVSVVVCVYNGEAYIARAIRSVLSQSFRDFQLIIVNDGSTDKTAVIIDDFAATDSRIEVIHQDNSGVAAARQCGVNHAKGQYLLFVDADDWIDESTLERMVAHAEETNSDMVWADAVYENIAKSGTNTEIKKINIKENIETWIKALVTWNANGALWLWLFKTELFRKPFVHFPQNSIYSEDLPVIVSALLYCNKISYLPETHYHYTFANQTSLTNQGTSHRRLDHGIIPAINHMDMIFHAVSGADKYLEPLMRAKLFTIRNYVDDEGIRDYKKFVTTFPDAIDAMKDYPTYPKRLKIIAWFAKREMYLLADVVRKFYGLLRRLKISDIGDKEWIKCQ